MFILHEKMYEIQFKSLIRGLSGVNINNKPKLRVGTSV